jgi:hypothetical protein
MVETTSVINNGHGIRMRVVNTSTPIFDSIKITSIIDYSCKRRMVRLYTHDIIVIEDVFGYKHMMRVMEPNARATMIGTSVVCDSDIGRFV